MDLKLRAVPQEVYGVMELNENFNFQWNPDPVSSLIGLGTSYVLEFSNSTVSALAITTMSLFRSRRRRMSASPCL